MKKLISTILCVAILLTFSGCSKGMLNFEVTEDDAQEYLTTFFSSYTKMNNYLKDSDIAISAFALDGQGLSSILKAVYQSQGVTFAFSKPTMVSENTFTATVNVVAPDIEPLYEMYAIDRLFQEGDIPDDFVAQTFYNNICAGTTSSITTAVSITVRYDNLKGGWIVDPSNDLAFAIFPNIDKAG